MNEEFVGLFPAAFTSSSAFRMRRFIPPLSPWIQAIAVALAIVAGWPAAAQAQRAVTGIARWTDARDNPHPVRGAAVQLLDADRNVAVGSGSTDNAGWYRVVLTGPGVRNVTAVVRAASPFASLADTVGRLYEMRTLPRPVPPGVQDIVLPDLRGAASTAANQAFGMLDAISYGAEFRRNRTGAAPPPVGVVFPALDKISGFDGTRLFVTTANAWDWDVVLHEYGHYIARLDTLSDAPFGEHFLNKSIAGEKGKALRLAWAEGWATWFSVAVQQEAGLAKLGIPEVGDSGYRDSGVTKAVDLNNPAKPSWSLGERSEVTVARVLYDLADAGDAKQAEAVEMGPDRLWKALRAGRPTSLWDAWKLIRAALQPAEQQEALRILEAQLAAPLPVQPADGARLGGAPPSFLWLSKDMPEWVLTVRDGGGAVLYVRQGATGAAHVPDSQDWNAVVAAAAGRPLFWQVQASSSEKPGTGPYPGLRRAIHP